MNNSILSCKGISKSFRKSENVILEIVKDVDLQIEKNKITVIVGASGAGKSTLLHILGGIDKPDKGEVIIEEVNIYKLTDNKLSDFRNKNLGFVFQFHHLLPEFTANENVAIPAMINGQSKIKAIEEADILLSQLGLGERLEHKPAELSGGEQQRVAIARALINKPKIIFADEPTGNLDSKNSAIVHETFLKLKNDFNQTLLIVTHNKDLVELADTVFEMKDGKLV
ncbi:MAG: ABC transporter ATP-binding protein [Melioribacteraceae bacterium]|jgi:lipoprotein-releasing system ATP-binding protein|nr:ABC transporter ATP-binding protein [Melioribacteraceae bacterium]